MGTREDAPSTSRAVELTLERTKNEERITKGAKGAPGKNLVHVQGATLQKLRRCPSKNGEFSPNVRGPRYAVTGHMPLAPKPFEIKARVFMFACDVVHAFPKTRLGAPSLKVWSQLIASATSSGAHLEEAAAGGSRAHFLALDERSITRNA